MNPPAYRVGKNRLEIAQPGARSRFEQPSYVLCFGVVGATFVASYEPSLEDALEDCADYLADQEYFGHITPHDLPQEALGCDCSDPFECESHTYTEAGWLTSHEWGIALDHPTRAQLIAFHHADREVAS